MKPPDSRLGWRRNWVRVNQPKDSSTDRRQLRAQVSTKKTLRWLDKWWHAPIDAAIQTIYRTVENAATRPPLPKEDAEKLRDVTPHEQFTGDEAFDEFRQKLKKRLGLDP